jgi:hypothetical protein
VDTGKELATPCAGGALARCGLMRTSLLMLSVVAWHPRVTYRTVAYDLLTAVRHCAICDRLAHWCVHQPLLSHGCYGSSTQQCRVVGVRFALEMLAKIGG